MGSLEEVSTVPLIDISPFLSLTSTLESRGNVIKQVRSACQEYGFFELIGHGIPVSLQRDILLCAERLFDLPLEQKKAMAMSKSPGLSKRGYEAMGGQVLDKKPDNKEGFYIGVETPAEDQRAGQFCIGPNIWPDGLSDEEFKEPVMRYHAEGVRVHETLLKIIAMGLPYGGDVFDVLMTDPVANIKLLHYPPNPGKSPTEAPVGGLSPTTLSFSKTESVHSWDAHRFWYDHHTLTATRPPWPRSFASQYQDLDSNSGSRRCLDREPRRFASEMDKGSLQKPIA